MPELYESLRRLVPPRERPDFDEELWDRIEERERAAARRWRRTSIALAVLAVAAVATTGVLAFARGSSILDQTLTCPVQVHAGLPELHMNANALVPSSNGSYPASALLVTGADTQLLAFDTAHSGVLLNRSLCRPAAKIPLARLGLPSRGVFRKGDYAAFTFACERRGPVVFRLRLVKDDSGVPTSAQIAVRLGRRGTPVAYVSWTPARVATYASPRC